MTVKVQPIGIKFNSTFANQCIYYIIYSYKCIIVCYRQFIWNRYNRCVTRGYRILSCLKRSIFHSPSEIFFSNIYFFLVCRTFILNNIPSLSLFIFLTQKDLPFDVWNPCWQFGSVLFIYPNVDANIYVCSISRCEGVGRWEVVPNLFTLSRHVRPSGRQSDPHK